jgi:hypothetical protein
MPRHSAMRLNAGQEFHLLLIEKRDIGLDEISGQMRLHTFRAFTGVLFHAGSRPSTTSPASSASGSSGIAGVSTPPYTPYFFHSTQYICLGKFGDFLIALHCPSPVRCLRYQLLAPEWQSVDQVGPGYYPTHALDTLLVDLHGILIQALHGKLFHLNSP